MKITENLRAAAEKQRELAAALENECKIFEENDLAVENAKISMQLENLSEQIKKISVQVESLTDENSILNNSLYEQIFNEKINIVNNTSQKLNIYFRSEVDGELDKLTIIEQNVRYRIKNLKETLAQANAASRDEFNSLLDEISARLDKKITEERAKHSRAESPFSQEERDSLDELKKEEISDEQIFKITKKNNIEKFVGLNVLNVIGIFLLVVGVITAMRYTYMNVSDSLKGILIFAFGGIMLAVGEYLNQKKPNAFSLGISAGGIAILYAALAISYFSLQIIPMYLALLISTALTVGAFTLSVRYKSQVIASFALIGGYLPIISILENADKNIFVYGAMFYFFTLNLFALSISWRRKWRVTAFIGLFLNIIGTAYICLFSGYEKNIDSDKFIFIAYSAFAFFVYTIIPIVSTYHAKVKFSQSDIVLLAINTFFSAVIIYSLFISFELNKYTGLLAVAFALVYISLSFIVEYKFSKEEKNIKTLFFLTSIAFAAMIIPMQFGRVWLSLGWLAQGVVLAVYGIMRDEKRFKRAGFIICALCAGVLLIFDLPSKSWNEMFVWQYSAVTLGSLIILGVHMYKKIMNNTFINIYKYFVLVNIWIYSVYIIHELGDIIKNLYTGDIINQINYLVSAVSITMAFLIAYAAPRIKLLYSNGIKVYSIALYAVGIIWLFVNNLSGSPVGYGYFSRTTPNIGITLAGTAVLLVLSVLSVLALRDAMKIIITGRKKGIEWLPLVVSGYFIVILSQNLVAQYNLSFSSAVISIIYVLTALAWILYGFIYRFAFIRRFGLALSIFAVVKLFLVDLSGLTQGYRIVSYFALGVILIAISFVYQYFSKKLELKSNVKTESGKIDE